MIHLFMLRVADIKRYMRMKIYRGPRSTNNWTKTDSKPANKWAKQWFPGQKVPVDGTIEKSGLRHTDLGVEIEEEDVLALVGALLRHQKSRIKALQKEVKILTEAHNALATANGKINALVARHREEAPSPTVLLDDIQNISAHAGRPELRKRKVRLTWINLDEV